VSNFDPGGSLPVRFKDGAYGIGPDGRHERLVEERVSVLHCPGCRQGVVVVEEETIEGKPRRGLGGAGVLGWRGTHWWPPVAVPTDPAIPDEIRSTFAEGMRCLGAQAPRAAAVMFRRTLEAIVAGKGSATAQAASTLAKALKQMATEGSLSGELAAWADEIRVVGNAGAHFDPGAAVSASEAEELARLTKALLEYLYEHPARIRRTRGKAP
jgi:uncharacterized protein DUF4145